MNRTLNALVFALTASLATTGCIEVPLAILAIDALDGPDEPYAYEYDDYDSYGVDTGYVDTPPQTLGLEGQMRGALPQTTPFDGELVGSTIWESGSWVELDFHVENGDWAMLGGGFDLGALDGDGHAVLTGAEHAIIGCAGPERNVFDVDEPASQVEVWRETVWIDGEAMIELHVVAEFEEGFEIDAVAVHPAPNPED